MQNALVHAQNIMLAKNLSPQNQTHSHRPQRFSKRSDTHLVVVVGIFIGAAFRASLAGCAILTRCVQLTRLLVH